MQLMPKTARRLKNNRTIEKCILNTSEKIYNDLSATLPNNLTRKHQYTGMTTCYLNKNAKNYGTERLIFHIVDKSANI